MGYVIHRAVVVTTDDAELYTKAYEVAITLFGAAMVLGQRTPSINGYLTFCVTPTGSKEGWVNANANQRLREEFMEWCRDHEYEDMSSPIDVVEITYGDSDEAFVSSATGIPTDISADKARIKYLEDRQARQYHKAAKMRRALETLSEYKTDSLTYYDIINEALSSDEGDVWP